jgi:hypothetical protein
MVHSQYLYNFSNPSQPNLVCQTVNTQMRLLDGNAITYLKGVAGKAVLIRRDLVTKAEFAIGQLPADPRQSFAGWTADGSLEVYATSAQNDVNLIGMHLWSGGPTTFCTRSKRHR